MAKITLKDVPPYDGEYGFDVEREYSGHELHLIKNVAGLRLNEIQDAAKAGDYDLFVSLATIVLWREGKVKREEAAAVADVLLAAKTGSLTFDFEEEDARPPDETTPKPDESSTPLSATSNGHSEDPQEITQVATGNPG
jgi:hypothetical protein